MRILTLFDVATGAKLSETSVPRAAEVTEIRVGANAVCLMQDRGESYCAGYRLPSLVFVGAGYSAPELPAEVLEAIQVPRGEDVSSSSQSAYEWRSSRDDWSVTVRAGERGLHAERVFRASPGRVFDRLCSTIRDHRNETVAGAARAVGLDGTYSEEPMCG